MNPRDMFTIKRGSPLAKLMKKTKCIVVDEAPMMDKKYLEKIDMTLCDIMENEKLFGGNLLFIIFFLATKLCLIQFR